jgi:ribosomal protein L37AE/L43A
MDGKIRWAPRLPTRLLERLYEQDACGIRDDELCDDVGSYLHARCETFYLVAHSQVICPGCGSVFRVDRATTSTCPSCAWTTDRATYERSITNHYAFPGRATDAFFVFYERFPKARTYADKIVLIDQLIHAFHIDERQSRAVKSVASKLLEGNKKDVVRFLDNLSARDPDAKQSWRETMGNTIDARIVKGRRTADA